MRPDEEALDLLAVELALGLSTPAVAARLEKIAADDPAVAMNVELWRIRFAELGGLVPEQAPSRELRGRVLREAIGVDTRPQGNRGYFWRVATAFLSVVVVLVGFGYGEVASRLETAEANLAAVIQGNEELVQAAAAVRTMGYLRGDEPGLWLVRIDGQAGEVTVRALEATQLVDSRVFELWLLPEASEAPRSMGLLTDNPSQLSRFELPAGMRGIVPGRGLAVSLEPSGGSPTGLPTGPVVYTGAVFEL